MKKSITLLLCLAVSIIGCTSSDVHLAERVEKASYKIGVITTNPDVPQVWGSGTAISEHEILTCKHLFEFGEKKIFVKDASGNCNEARIARVSPTKDLVLLYVLTDKMDNHLRIAKTKPRVGETVFSLGYPLAGPIEFCKGIVSGYVDNLIMSDVLIMNGSSGGALVNKNGEVVGVTVMSTSRLEGAQGISLSVSLRDIKEFIND